jgi:sodium-dependent phosphate cotransporter
MPAPAARRYPAPIRVAAVILLLFGFLVAIKMMGGAIQLLGEETSKGLFEGVSNPFAGLSVGVLATVLVQSSSTTTSTIVSLVGSGALKVVHAVPMVMGANIGTTVTNTMVSIGHVRHGPEFGRAFAAATVHDFFNLLCVIVFLPLELATGFLASTAEGMTDVLYGDVGGGKFDSPIKCAVGSVYDGVKAGFGAVGLENLGLALAVLITGVILTFICLVLITKNMRVLISGRLETALNRSLGRSGLIGIGVGAMITVAVQSSSITTSLLVPMCAAGVLTLRNAFPIMLGANLGTTVTALLASLAADRPEGLTIALVHLLFNMCGILLFYPIPAVRHIPIRLAEGLARKAQKNPLWVVGYLLGFFVITPLVGYILFREIAGA